MANTNCISRFHCVSAAAVMITFVSGAAIGQTIRMGTDARLDAANVRSTNPSSQLAYVPVTVEVAADAHTFSLTAPHQHALTARTAFVSETATMGRLSAYAPDTGPTDVALAWKYRHALASDPALTFGYTARAKFDSAPGGLSYWHAKSEYLVRVDVQREFGPFVPRVEMGYRYAAHVPDGTSAVPRPFGAAGITYYASDRSSMELFFDQRSPVDGGPMQKELSFSWTERPSTRTRVVFYTAKSMSERWYEAGVKLSMRF